MHTSVEVVTPLWPQYTALPARLIKKKLLAIGHEEDRRALKDFGSAAGGHGTTIDAERSFCLTETIGVQEILILAVLE